MGIMTIQDFRSNLKLFFRRVEDISKVEEKAMTYKEWSRNYRQLFPGR
jgi:hypothetical protein